ncbi:MAG: NAD(P)H-dependent oxidoreductase subunit E [Aquabacterium sp.]|uniref:NAD(P)H-dependent oxidoreductase subunit E n=1 Tax=Aquabacterium sp. TaxID=1872578 RepID=UPI0025C23A17|nr:NAD(P)H-dependent oxidoreductase subunit E [Aquabacterium sp.]MBI5926959.1 NAD(P)H-dependent oxidoreductase subunit E [Aquabacterium sp.]
MDSRDDISDILQRYQAGPGALLQVLRQIQSRFQHVPASAITTLVQQWGLSYAAVRSVVSFYHFLSFEPRGRYTLYLSDSVTDRMLGSEAVLLQLCQRLGVTMEETRPDGLVSLHRTSCTGLCDQGPAGLVNGRPLTRLTMRRADEVADLILAGSPLDQWPADFFEVNNPVWRHQLTLSHPIAPGQALARLKAIGPDALLGTLREAGLRGRGGAGFATWQKWAACRQAPGPRAITCNADEGEPGTFKDRMLLMQWAHEVIEGMTLAALTVGAEQGFLYVRGEYEFIEPHLHEVLQARRVQGLLGADVLGTGQRFDVELHMGAGAYVCGEETALIESVEGKRGIPRTRPPFPVDRGYLGLPTVNNNVETFVQVAQIALHGADWFKAQGTSASCGTRILSVAGDVARPGLYEVPWGVTVAEVLRDCGALDVQAVLVGGPSGKLIDASQLQRQISFEDLPTGGAFTVFNQTRDMLDTARQYTRFFAHESCGFCTPCRVGCGQLVETAERLVHGHASARDIDRLKETAELMRHLSHCGLGQTAAHPLMDVIAHFPDQVNRRLVPDEQAFDLDDAVVDMHALTLHTSPT